MKHQRRTYSDRSNKSILILIFFAYLNLNCVRGWHEAAECTSTLNTFDLNYNAELTDDEYNNNNNNNNNLNINSQNANNNAPQMMNLNCGENLIFIASSQYGQRSSADKRTSYNLLYQNKTKDEQCYFSPEDCLVNVDYVANQCNGLSTCQISLDSQYLHSCKAYSDYVFIVYECIEAKSTVNICETAFDKKFVLNANENIMYLKTPNYPNEYLNNLDCKCSMRTSEDSTIQFELLEFDIESTDDYLLRLTDNEHQYAQHGAVQKRSCSKDYFSINSNVQMCGTLSPFTTLFDVQPINNHQITNFRFFSDDSLTRRGIWLKLKLSNFVLKCEEGFILVDNICVKVFSNQQLTWYEAQNYCSSMGYSLLQMDNFELEKKINTILFDKNSIVQQRKNITLSKFWTGVKHLNRTNWFDARNQLLNLRADEQTWWPWLIMDAKTYNHGSCVAKRESQLFLEDCYKRMSFACQYKPHVPSRPKESHLHLKCGQNENYFQEVASFVSVEEHAKSGAFSTSNQVGLALNKSKKNTTTQSINKPIRKMDAIKIDSSLQTNKAKSGVNLPIATQMNNHSSAKSEDSTILISLISSITLLIAVINTIVIFILCKRRKQFLNEQLKELSKNNSKLSNDFTSCVNLDDSNGTETCTDNSLKFAGSYLIQAPEHTPFSYTLQPTTHNKLNSARQSMFVPDVQSSYLRSALANNQQALIGQHTMKPTVARNQTLRNPLINANDPLSHIYDTISITSANNTTCGFQRQQQQQQQQQHYNHLFNQNTNCPYFEIDNSTTGSRKPILVSNNANTQANEMHLIDYFTNQQQNQIKRFIDNSQQVGTQQRAKINLLQPVQFHSSCSPSSSSMTTSTNVITPPSIESNTNAMNSFRRSAFNPINATEYYENFGYLNPNQASQHLASNSNEAVV